MKPEAPAFRRGVVHRVWAFIILESGEQNAAIHRLAEDLPLFSAALKRPPPKAAAAPEAPSGPSPVEVALASLDPDSLTPREALEELYRLRGMVK